MSQQYEKQEASTPISYLLVPAGVIAIAGLGMFIISISLILFTGIVFGSNHSLELKLDTQKKKAAIVVISYTRPLEDEIRRANLGTPELPLEAHYHKDYSLSNFQFSYRY